MAGHIARHILTKKKMMVLRPINCPDPFGCDPIESGFDRLCFGCLRKKRAHDDLFNTHSFCWDGEQTEVNDEDAWIFIKGFKAIRKDVQDNNLYRPPGFKDTWDFAKGEV